MTDELAEIGACIDAYFEGMRTSTREPLERAFHPSAVVAGPDDGVLKTMSREDFVQLALKQPPAPDAPMAIQSIDVAGGIATARVEDEYLGRVFVDQLALVKLDGRWQILTKLWHVVRKVEP
jgi:hypothetical protein